MAKVTIVQNVNDENTIDIYYIDLNKNISEIHSVLDRCEMSESNFITIEIIFDGRVHDGIIYYLAGKLRTYEHLHTLKLNGTPVANEANKKFFQGLSWYKSLKRLIIENASITPKYYLHILEFLYDSSDIAISKINTFNIHNCDFIDIYLFAKV